MVFRYTTDIMTIFTLPETFILNIYNTKLARWLHKHHFSVRVVIAVAAGIAFSKVLTVITHEILHAAGVFPKLSEPMFDRDKLMIELAFHTVYTIAGAFLVAHVAREKAKRAVFIFGTKEAILWLVGIILLWKQMPGWFNLTKAVIGIPLSIFGGWLYSIYKERNAKTIA